MFNVFGLRRQEILEHVGLVGESSTPLRMCVWQSSETAGYKTTETWELGEQKA